MSGAPVLPELSTNASLPVQEQTSLRTAAEPVMFSLYPTVTPSAESADSVSAPVIRPSTAALEPLPSEAVALVGSQSIDGSQSPPSLGSSCMGQVAPPQSLPPSQPQQASSRSSIPARHIVLPLASSGAAQRHSATRNVCGRVLVIGFWRVCAEICNVLKAGREVFQEEVEGGKQSVCALINSKQALKLPQVDDDSEPVRFHPCITVIPLSDVQLPNPDQWREVWASEPTSGIEEPTGIVRYSTVFVGIEANSGRVLLENYQSLLKHLESIRPRTVLVFSSGSDRCRPDDGQVYSDRLLEDTDPPFCVQMLGYRDQADMEKKQKQLKAERKAWSSREGLRGPCPQLSPRQHRLLSWHVDECSPTHVREVRRLLLSNLALPGFEESFPVYVPTQERQQLIRTNFAPPPVVERTSLLQSIFPLHKRKT